MIDGDTVKVNINGKLESIRIIGLDTPEVVDPRKVVQCFGREASAKAKEMLNGQQVRLVADPTQDNRDKYDRLLRYVDRADGMDFGLTMIGAGYAHEYTYEVPYQRQAPYKAAEASAREKAQGLWSPTTCNGDTTQPADQQEPTVPPVLPPALPVAPVSVAPAAPMATEQPPTAPTVAPALPTATTTRLVATATARPATPTATPRPAPSATTQPASRAGCDPSYPDVCIPRYPPDLDCNQLPYKRFRVVGPDAHRLDADKDGIGCES